MTSRPTSTLEQASRSASQAAFQATVTGVDSSGQLFRDTTTIIFLKAKKCVFISKYKPSSDGSLMVETRSGKEAWRSNAKVRNVSHAAPGQNSYRVTVELDRAHDLIIEGVEEELIPVSESENASSLPSAGPAISNGAKPLAKPRVALETAPPEPVAEPEPDMQLSAAPAKRIDNAPEFDLAPLNGPSVQAPASTSPGPSATPAARAMVAENVRSIMAGELEQLKKELQGMVASQAVAAVQKQIEASEARIEQRLQETPAITEQSVKRIAAQAAEKAKQEWASASQEHVAEAVRSAITTEGQQQRRDLQALVSSEIDAAVRGPLASRMDGKIESAIEATIEEHFRKRPAMTEATVRQVAGQVAESIQLEWASTKLQKMIVEAVRSSTAAESVQRRAETVVVVSDELETFMRGPLATRMNSEIEKTLTAKLEQYWRTPSAIGALQKLIAEGVRQPLEAEYEQRARQVQAAVSNEIESAVRGPIAAQMDEMLRKALEAQRQEYARNPPPITDETMRVLTANIAQHPQLTLSIDALTSHLSDRWAEIARGATADAQQDINSRIAATERLANQVVLDIQQKLNAFNLEMTRILGPQELSSPSEGGSDAAGEPEREGRFRELLQSTGSHFEREMKAALQRIFGKS